MPGETGTELPIQGQEPQGQERPDTTPHSKKPKLDLPEGVSEHDLKKRSEMLREEGDEGEVYIHERTGEEFRAPNRSNIEQGIAPTTRAEELAQKDPALLTESEKKDLATANTARRLVDQELLFNHEALRLLIEEVYPVQYQRAGLSFDLLKTGLEQGRYKPKIGDLDSINFIDLATKERVASMKTVSASYKHGEKLAGSRTEGPFEVGYNADGIEVIRINNQVAGGADNPLARLQEVLNRYGVTPNDQQIFTDALQEFLDIAQRASTSDYYYSTAGHFRGLLRQDPSGQFFRREVKALITAGDYNVDVQFPKEVAQDVNQAIYIAAARYPDLKEELDRYANALQLLHDTSFVAKYIGAKESAPPMTNFYDWHVNMTIDIDGARMALARLKQNQGLYFRSREAGQMLRDLKRDLILNDPRLGRVNKSKDAVGQAVYQIRNKGGLTFDEEYREGGELGLEDIFRDEADFRANIKDRIRSLGVNVLEQAISKGSIELWRDKRALEGRLTGLPQGSNERNQVIGQIAELKLLLIAVTSAERASGIAIKWNNNTAKAAEYSGAVSRRDPTQLLRPQEIMLAIPNNSAIQINFRGATEELQYLLANRNQHFRDLEAVLPTLTNRDEQARNVQEQIDILRSFTPGQLETAADRLFRRYIGREINIANVEQEDGMTLEDRVALAAVRGYAVNNIAIATANSWREFYADRRNYDQIDLLASSGPPATREMNQSVHFFHQAKPNSKNPGLRDMWPYAYEGGMAFETFTARGDLEDQLDHWDQDYVGGLRSWTDRMAAADDLKEAEVKEEPRLEGAGGLRDPIASLKKMKELMKDIPQSEKVFFFAYKLEGAVNFLLYHNRRVFRTPNLTFTAASDIIDDALGAALITRQQALDVKRRVFGVPRPIYEAVILLEKLNKGGAVLAFIKGLLQRATAKLV